jgi:hypothetical protein
LDLRDNDLQELPEDFPEWMHLNTIFLTDNPLSPQGLALHEQWKSNKRADFMTIDPLLNDLKE